MASEEIPVYMYDKVTGHFYNKSGRKVGSYKNRKYGRACHKGKHVALARLAFFLVEGWWPDEVDHINGDTHDDRWDNLRASTRPENAKNRRIYKSNRLGYKGVYPSYYKNKVYYNASIQVDRKRIYLGRHKSAEDAAKIYNTAALKYHGDFASLNNVKEN